MRGNRKFVKAAPQPGVKRMSQLATATAALRDAARSQARASSSGFAPQRAIGQSNEKGFVDLALATYPANTTGQITLVATIPQNASVNGRVNKKIMLKSVQVRGRVLADTATIVAGAAILLVYDRRPTGALPPITDVLVSASSNAFTNNDNQGRFSILYRRDYQLSGNSTTPATGNEIASINDFVKVNRRAVFKSLATGAIGDIEEGALYMITVGDVAAGTTDANFVVQLRTTFKDIM